MGTHDIPVRNCRCNSLVASWPESMSAFIPVAPRTPHTAMLMLTQMQDVFQPGCRRPCLSSWVRSSCCVSPQV